MVKLKPGETFCPKCEGRTLVKGIDDDGIFSYKLFACPICLGTGKLDWIDLIKGYKESTSYIWGNHKTFMNRYDDGISYPYINIDFDPCPICHNFDDNECSINFICVKWNVYQSGIPENEWDL